MAFPTTRWSLLAQATIHGDAMQREALAEFYRRYREPVVSYLRRHQPEARADDLSQEFFLHLIENSTLQRAGRAQLVPSCWARSTVSWPARVCMRPPPSAAAARRRFPWTR